MLYAYNHNFAEWGVEDAVNVKKLFTSISYLLDSVVDADATWSDMVWDWYLGRTGCTYPRLYEVFLVDSKSHTTTQRIARLWVK